jgi:hypothetical protein
MGQACNVFLPSRRLKLDLGRRRARVTAAEEQRLHFKPSFLDGVADCFAGFRRSVVAFPRRKAPRHASRPACSTCFDKCSVVSRLWRGALAPRSQA